MLPDKFHASTLIWRYAVALAAVIVVFALRLLLHPVLEERAPLLLFTLAVFVAAYYGGLGPGLVSTTLSALLGIYLFINPQYSLYISNNSEMVNVLLFLVIGIAISMLNQALRHARQKSEADFQAVSETAQLLKKSEQQLRLLIEGVQDYAIYLLDQDGRVVSWNTGAERIKGYRAEEIIGEHFSRFYPEEEKLTKPARELRIAATEGKYVEEGWRVRRDGSRFWAHVSIAALHDESGQLFGFAKVTRDVTEREQAAENLRKSEKRMQLALDAGQMGVWEYYPQTGRVELDARQKMLYSIPPEQANLTVDSVWNAIHPADRPEVEKALKRTVKQNAMYEAEFRVLRPDGSTRWITGAALPLSSENEPENSRIIGINYDSTKRKEAEAEIKSLNENLEQLVAVRTAELTEINQELEAFTYTVSHDLRAPLRAIQGFSQALVEDYADQLDDTAREYIQAIETAALRMGNLIQDLLDYSRLSRAEIRLQAVDLESVVIKVLKDLKLEIAERRADVSVKTPLPTVWAHPATLGQAVTNLLSNSIKFTALGKQPFIRVWAEERNKSVRLWIEDQGIGIAPEHLERIFGVFERLHGIEAYSGTGIGLAIVRRAAERMNGAVGVESKVEEGSRFWIELEKFKKTS